MHVMDPEEVGTWMVIGGNSLVFLGLFNLGVTPTLTRHIALAKGTSGADPNVELSPETEHRIADLAATGRAIFRVMAIVTSVVAFFVGWLFLRHAPFDTVSPPKAPLVAWLIVCIGYGVAVWVQYLECWMLGVGLLRWNASIIAGVAVATLLINSAAVLLGGGLISLACILVAPTWCNGDLRLVRCVDIPRLFALRGHWNRE